MKTKAQTLIQKAFQGKATARQIDRHVTHGGEPAYIVVKDDPSGKTTNVVVSRGDGLIREGNYSLEEWEKLVGKIDEDATVIRIRRINRLTIPIDED